MPRSPRALVALLLAIPATAVAGCGATSAVQNAVDPVAQAAQHAADAGGAQMTLHLVISAAGQTIPMDGSGVVDERAGQGRFTLSLSVPGTGAMKMDEILTGHTVYVHMPAALGSALPGGKPWIKLDLDKLGKSMGVDFGALQQASGDQLGQYLSFLRGAGGAQAVGTETVRGVPTTHYQAYIDFNKAEHSLGGALKGALKKLQDQLGVESMPVDVWIDHDQLVRRVTAQLHTQGAVPVSMDMEMDVLRYHVPVDVTPPDASQVFDASSIAAKG
jgi:hypothetical protein